MQFAPRGHALGFANRTRKNLEFIEEAYKKKEDVHVVTQVAISLLGLIVFPKEQLSLDENLKKISLNSLHQEGWPQWEILQGTCETLYDLVRHLRNATSHGHLDFSSNSRVMEEVDIKVTDRDWQARICVKELRDFCFRFIDLLEGWLI